MPFGALLMASWHRCPKTTVNLAHKRAVENPTLSRFKFTEFLCRPACARRILVPQRLRQRAIPRRRQIYLLTGRESSGQYIDRGLPWVISSHDQHAAAWTTVILPIKGSHLEVRSFSPNGLPKCDNDCPNRADGGECCPYCRYPVGRVRGEHRPSLAETSTISENLSEPAPADL